MGHVGSRGHRSCERKTHGVKIAFAFASTNVGDAAMSTSEVHMPVDLVLVRHGQSEGNLYDEIEELGAHIGKQQEADAVKRQLHGRHTSEGRLTDLGRHQAQRAGKLLIDRVVSQIGSFDKAYVSSYARAMETAACLDMASLRFHVHLFLREKETVKEWGRSGVDLRAAFGWGGSSSINTFYGDATGLESPADLLIRIRLFLDHLARLQANLRVSPPLMIARACKCRPEAQQDEEESAE